MRKITRIKITNYGAESWFKDTTLNLDDPATGQATDTIINLENGGGKTTLLAFIFSCFEPRQERFLQHIQKKQHQFTDYFAKDGTPGVILIEWQTPGQDDRLVIGQVVSVLPERTSPDRAFFAFSSTQDLNLDTVPLHFKTFGEWSHWLSATQGTSDFYQTRGQNDWQRHLDTRNIDVDVFRLQLEFSAEEGGIDAFLNFRNESEFVRRFFKQTLDRDRAASVRTIVVQTCDALGRKPHLQQQQRELSTLAREVDEFALTSAAYAQELSQRSDTVAHVSGVVRTLSERALAQHEQAKTLSEQAAGYAQVEQEGAAQHADLDAQRWALEGLALRRRNDDAQALLEAAQESLDDAQRDARLLAGAQALVQLDGTKARLQGLLDTAHAQESGLAPAREAASLAGFYLKATLSQALKAQQATVTTLLNEEALSADIKKDQQQRLVDLDRRRQHAERRHAELSAQRQVGEAQRQRLIDDGLVEANETPAAAHLRWVRTTLKHRADQSAHQENLLVHEQDVANVRRAMDATRQDVEQARAQTVLLQRTLDEARVEYERLAQHEVLRQALDSDTVNPDAVGLSAALDRLITSDDASLAHLNVRRAQLESDRQAVHETGVAGRQADVDTVVALLHKNGVPGAQAYNLFVAQSVLDANQAQSLVMSDPARFLGVGVPVASLDQARQVLAALPASVRLRAPVVVSAFTTDPTVAVSTSARDRMVTPPTTTAGFNRAAALEHVQSLDREITALDLQTLNARQRRDAGLAVKEQLRAYLERFGAEVREALNAQLAQHADTLEQAATDHALHAQNLAAAQEAVQAAQKALREAQEYAEQANRHARAVSDHVAHHEASSAQRAQEIDQLADDLDEIGAQREDVMVAVANADQRRDTARTQRFGHEATIAQHRQEISALVFEAPTGSVDALSTEETLDTLRRRFQDATQLLNTQEQERMGVLKVKIDQATHELAQAQQAFDARFGDLPQAWMRDRFGATLEQDVITANERVVDLQTRLNDATTAHTLARHDQSSFEKQHRKLAPLTPAQEACSPAELDAARAEVQERLNVWTHRMEEARTQIGSVRDRARDAQDAARRLESHATTLRAVVDVQPNATAVVLDEDAAAVDAVVADLLASYKGHEKSSGATRKKAEKAFRSLITMISRPAFQEVEPQLADNLRSSGQDFDAACNYAATWQEQVAERASTVAHQIDSMKSNFDGCVDELLALTRDGERVLNSAVNNKRVPANAPMVGGKAVIKMKADFQRTPLDGKRSALSNYLDELIESRQIPELGTDLVAESLFRIHGQALGLQLLKMVPNEERQYMPVGEIKSSGGEGVTMALFLYMVINQLRAEMQTQMKKAGGGPLILDNPFAKMTNGSMWGAVRALADAMDIQLICATAISAEYNAFGEFRRFVRLRRTGTNPVTQKTHLEVADLVLKALPAATLDAVSTESSAA